MHTKLAVHTHTHVHAQRQVLIHGTQADTDMHLQIPIHKGFPAQERTKWQSIALGGEYYKSYHLRIFLSVCVVYLHRHLHTKYVGVDVYVHTNIYVFFVLYQLSPYGRRCGRDSIGRIGDAMGS